MGKAASKVSGEHKERGCKQMDEKLNDEMEKSSVVFK